MTLQTSGTITIAEINSEFSLGNNLNAYRGTKWYKDDGSSGTFPTGAISMSDFYGKRKTFVLTISSNQTNVDLRTLALSAGWDGSAQIIATINSDIYISSNSTSTPALTISGSFPGGVELTNNGYIVGMGGAGGNGGTTRVSPACNGSPGANGGGALLVSTALILANNGTIAGGGGGGGGGAEANGGGSTQYIGGGGGGGGRSSLYYNSAGGTNGGQEGATIYGGTLAGNGAAGTYTAAGAGGAAGSCPDPETINISYSGAGGNGGDWGQAGSAGGSRSGANYGGGSPGAGGAAGYAVSGNGYISWVATGTRLGSIG